MNENWFEIEIKVAAEFTETVSALLAEAGSDGIVVSERKLDTFEVPDFPDQSEGEIQIKVYFPPAFKNVSLNDLIEETLLPHFPFTIVGRDEIGKTDWSEGWKQYFPVTRIDRLVLRPSWEEISPEPDDIVLTIDPGMAFGTGTHETTKLCLEAFVRQAANVLPSSILDVGTGSGILAIAAALFGSEKIVACDIDPEAVRTTEKNADINDVAKLVSVSTTPLEEIAGTFDLVFANILAEENIRLADQLVFHVAKAGTLILSGILREKEPLVVEAFARFALIGPVVSYNNDWCSIEYRRQP